MDDRVDLTAVAEMHVEGASAHFTMPDPRPIPPVPSDWTATPEGLSREDEYVVAGAALPKWLGRSSPEGLVTLHGERFTVEATGESETLNLGSHGEQIGHWYPVKSPLYRLVPYRPENTKGAGDE